MISSAQVRAIRRGYDAGISQAVLATRYKLSRSMIYLICAGLRYREVVPHKSDTAGQRKGKNRGRPLDSKKLNRATIQRMKLFRKRGYSYKELAKIFRVSQATCHRYCTQE